MQQDAAVAAVLEAVLECAEVKAVFLKGSLAKGTADGYSDVDFYCLVEPVDLNGFLPKRLGLLESYRPVIYHSTSDFVGPQLVAVFDDGLHFDLYTVTEATFPLVGKLRALHDPKHLLDQFILREQDHAISSQDLVTRFNEFSFTLLEFLAAWQRGDLAWANRLASHLAGDLSVILRHQYDPSNARLGMKRLESVLPVELRDQLRAALQDCGGQNLPAGVLTLSALLRGSLQQLPSSISQTLDWRLFELMHSRITDCAMAVK